MVKLLSEKLYLILGKDNDLGNKLHSHYVYECERSEQMEAKIKIGDLIEGYSDNKLLGLIIEFCETLAKGLGFTRFSVEYPNRGFWEKVGYKIPERYRIGESDERNYTHEGYKEIDQKGQGLNAST